MMANTSFFNSSAAEIFNNVSQHINSTDPPVHSPYGSPGPYYRMAEDLWKIAPPVIIGVGTIGNMLTIVVMLRQFRRITSTSLYLLSLAVSDTVILYSSPLRKWIQHTWEVNIRGYSEFGCKCSVYITYVSFQLSSWLLVAVTMERVISVLWPHKVRMGCTRSVAGVVITVMLVTILTLNSHLLYGYGRSPLPQFQGQSVCDPLNVEYNRFNNDIWPWVDFTVVFAVPFACLLVGNAIIIYNLRKSRLTRREMSASRGQQAAERDAKILTVTLVLLSVVFFVCLTPVSIYFIYKPYVEERLIKLMQTDVEEFVKQAEILIFCYAVVNIISYLNAMLNFGLYVVSGSKFRREVRALFCCEGTGRRGGIFGSTSGSSKATKTSSVTFIRDQSTNRCWHEEKDGAMDTKRNTCANVKDTPVERDAEDCVNFVNAKMGSDMQNLEMK